MPFRNGRTPPLMDELAPPESKTPSNTQQGRTIAIDSPLGPDALLLTSVEGQDAISQCFVYTVEFATQAKDEDVRKLIGQPVTIWLQNHQGEDRQPINGFIRRLIDRPPIHPGFALYRAEVVPRLWFLDCVSDCRIFQDKTTPEIIREVLGDYNVAVTFNLLKLDYPVHNYCVQYRESALAFVSRLMEHAGIFFFHTHEDAGHTLVITDSNQFTPFMSPRLLTLSWHDRQGEIQAAATETVFRPGAWALADFDFHGPTKQLTQNIATNLEVAQMPDFERFDYPGGYTDATVGAWLTELRMQAEEAQFNRMLGVACCASMATGARFEFERFDGREPTTYLITEIQHHARETSYFAAPGAGSSYSNDFVAIPARVPFRPQRVTPRPVIPGAQTAIVVSASADDPIQVDDYGRVKVHFHWDRRGKPGSGATSCWLRVSQNSAGAGFGGLFTPHAGQEVIVEFLEGDPDRPLITGRVHNADKIPPLHLPDDKHKSITRDHGNNKIVMQGKAGREFVSTVSPRAVNQFASYNIVKPLSSDTTGTASSDNPFTGANPWVDSTAFHALETLWETTYKYTADSTIADGTSAATYNSSVNTATDGVVNSLSGDNTNTWVCGNANTWVGGNTNSLVEKGANAIVLAYNLLEVVGLNSTAIVGDNLTVIAGATETFQAAVNLTATLGLNAIFNLAATWQLNKGYQYTICMPPDEKHARIATAANQPVTDAAAAAAKALQAAQAAATVDQNGGWAVTATGACTVTAGKGWAVTVPVGDYAATAAAGNIALKSTAISLEAAAATTLKAASVSVTATGNVSITGSGTASMSGAMIQIG